MQRRLFSFVSPLDNPPLASRRRKKSAGGPVVAGRLRSSLGFSIRRFARETFVVIVG
ncbi:MAG: hypothetical protein JWM57_2075 [Phycisphaerales bacterium]|nr:hypothetical protein [Phycisphaerales bacterium]